MIITNKELLNSPCEEIYSTEEANEIINKLEKELKNSNEPGIGLAANQIGINKRVCIIRIDGKEPINLINPVIKEEQFLIEVNEGCLSFPGSQVRTKRYNKIKVVDSLVPTGRYLYGLDAICAQHEIDHLNGITMYEREDGQ